MLAHGMINKDDILKARILVVDDMQDNVDVLSMLLNVMGYRHVANCTDPFEVAHLHAEHNYDLIILDMQMPGLSGLQVMQQLKSLGGDDYLPVLAVTGQEHLRIEALECGARDFIGKPFDPVELEKRIHNFLEVRLLYKQVAEHCKAQEELALHDALTGLPNRRLLEDRLQTALKHAARKGLPLALLYLDLDGFKLVNDTYGHDCGDKLLKEMAKRLGRTCRSEDTVARLGGDEFVIVLSDIHDGSAVRRLATDLVRTLSLPCAIDEHEVQVSASIGIAFYPDHADSVEALINSADQALYQAKRHGKNQYRFADAVPERPRGRIRNAERSAHSARTVGTG